MHYIIGPLECKSNWSSDQLQIALCRHDNILVWAHFPAHPTFGCLLGHRPSPVVGSPRCPRAPPPPSHFLFSTGLCRRASPLPHIGAWGASSKAMSCAIYWTKREAVQRWWKVAPDGPATIVSVVTGPARGLFGVLHDQNVISLVLMWYMKMCSFNIWLATPLRRSMA
jgi:hypothetical protein